MLNRVGWGIVTELWKALQSVEKLVTVYHSTRRYISEDWNLQQHCFNSTRQHLFMYNLFCDAAVSSECRKSTDKVLALSGFARERLVIGYRHFETYTALCTTRATASTIQRRKSEISQYQEV
jgi:hypothetical protein